MDNDRLGAVGHLVHFQNLAGGADAKEIIHPGVVYLCLSLSNARHHPRSAQCKIEHPLGLLAIDLQRHQRAGKNHRLSNRKNRELPLNPDSLRFLIANFRVNDDIDVGIGPRLIGGNRLKLIKRFGVAFVHWSPDAEARGRRTQRYPLR